MSKSVTAAEAAAQSEAEATRRNKAGLDSVLASLQAAKKVNVLDKSRSDWKDFKTSDTKVCARMRASEIPGCATPFCRRSGGAALIYCRVSEKCTLLCHPLALCCILT